MAGWGVGNGANQAQEGREEKEQQEEEVALARVSQTPSRIHILTPKDPQLGPIVASSRQHLKEDLANVGLSGRQSRWEF